MSTEIKVNAILTITEDDLRAALALASQKPLTVDLGPEPTETVVAPPAKRKYTRRTKTQAAPEPPPDEDIRIKVNPDDPIEAQIRTVIVQAAAHKHGDAVARKIFQSWTDEDTKAVTICRQIFGAVTLPTIAKAVMDSDEATLLKLPRLIMSGIFQAAADLEPKAQPIAVPKEGPRPGACPICEGVSTHKAGCPIGHQLRSTEADGGAMPSRVPNATPAPVAEAPEICAMGGPEHGCPIPDHRMILQGGAHIPVHTPETMRKLREAISPTAPVASVWSAPPPPKKPGKPARKARAKKK